MKRVIPLLACVLMGCSGADRVARSTGSLSGIYPRLAYYNNEGECGTGAVVPWAGRLWVITYGPHLPDGSSDKLYEVTPTLRQRVRSESIGGTPANRMIHRESGQLFIGPYAIDTAGRVRVIPYTTMPGRLTGNARHLTDPARKIYYGTMEEGLYEVDVRTLAVKELYPDGNHIPQKGGGYGPLNDLLPGVHGKGLYSGQGVVVYSNNGEGTREALSKFDVEAGVLAEWNGDSWKVVRRNQFTEITGPGGICGNARPATDPLWALGWDHKSVLLGVRDSARGWSFYRLPKASHSYDGAHGWNTEWPRIRNVGTEGAPDCLMTMHGMFWSFPASFSADRAAGLRPRSAYLKVIGDFARWQDKVVFGCDDSAQKEFLNTRKAKGRLKGSGQSNSNLWFVSPDDIDRLGPATAEGAVWSREQVRAGQMSEPFLFAGWDYRRCWIKNDGASEARFRFETDRRGNGQWETLRTVSVAPGEARTFLFPSGEKGEWVRVGADVPAVATVAFTYTDTDRRGTRPHRIFKGLAQAGQDKKVQGGLLCALGHDRRALGLLAYDLEGGQASETGYYEMSDSLRLVRRDDAQAAAFVREGYAVERPGGVLVEDASVLVTDDAGRRWRLPIAQKELEPLTDGGQLRVCREVATERDLFNCMGTFYELPAENADGYAKIRPVASHPYRIYDYASYRGMLVMTGISPGEAGSNPHVIVSDDGKAAVWAGAVDDLWKLGKPVGHGGPWFNDSVRAGDPSDPYLMGFYDRKKLSLSHGSDRPVTVKIEVDPTGNGVWMPYMACSVEPHAIWRHEFPEGFQAQWIRFTADSDVRATAWLDYE